MLLLSIWSEEDEGIFFKILETAWELFLHYLGGYALAVSFVVLFVFQSIPITFVFGDHCLGTTISETMNYITAMPHFNGWLVFLQMGWYYKIAVMIGWFFPVHHLITGYEELSQEEYNKNVTPRYEYDIDDPDLDDVKQYIAEMEAKEAAKKAKKKAKK